MYWPRNPVHHHAIYPARLANLARSVAYLLGSEVSSHTSTLPLNVLVRSNTLVPFRNVNPVYPVLPTYGLLASNSSHPNRSTKGFTSPGVSYNRHLHGAQTVLHRSQPSTSYSSAAGFAVGASSLMIYALSSRMPRSIFSLPYRLFRSGDIRSMGRISPPGELSGIRLNGLRRAPFQSLVSPPPRTYVPSGSASPPQMPERSSAPSAFGTRGISHHLLWSLPRTGSTISQHSTIQTNVLNHENNPSPAIIQGAESDSTSHAHISPDSGSARTSLAHHVRALLHSHSGDASRSSEGLPLELVSAHSLTGTRGSPVRITVPTPTTPILTTELNAC